MIDLILIIMLIISLFKPDVLLSKKVKQRASDEQKSTLAKNLRKTYGILIAVFESMALRRYVNEDFEILLLIVTIVLLILFFIFAIPAIKENSRITKELN